jgi:hypothetical protein
VLLGVLVSPWVWLVARWQRDEKEYGRDKVYTLPLRVCPACQPTLRKRAGIKECLRSVPEYDSLLDKFPAARVGLAK